MNTSITGEQLLDILIEKNYVSETEVRDLYRDSAHFDHVLQALVTEGITTRELIGQAIAEFYNTVYINLSAIPPMPEIVKHIPQELSQKYRLVLTEETENYVIIAGDSIWDNIPQEFADFVGSRQIRFGYSLPGEIDEVFRLYQSSFAERLEEIIGSGGGQVASRVVSSILDDAIRSLVSDIHFEPYDQEVIVRFRIDGVLQDIGSLDRPLYETILNRIKVLSHLRLDEHFETQDGAIRYESSDQIKVDIRVSVAPVIDGEKVVLRVLSSYIEQLSLESIGLPTKALDVVHDTVHRPFGMILVSGPTGSGKTTTLYSILRDINHPEVNITTIEDPVEYRIKRVNQIQVNEQKNITFPTALRSIVRQDPDVILVGEIRDRDTAEIAFNAALTGHLVLSTFHANDSLATLSRLYDMQVESFLLASTVDLIISQRLVRKICSVCKISKEISIKNDWEERVPGIKTLIKESKLNVYYGKGCQECSGTGYKGRTAVFEILAITPELRDMILQNITSVQNLDHTSLLISMFEDGLDKVRKGITTFDEVLRVVKVPDWLIKVS